MLNQCTSKRAISIAGARNDWTAPSRTLALLMFQPDFCADVFVKLIYDARAVSVLMIFSFWNVLRLSLDLSLANEFVFL